MTQCKRHKPGQVQRYRVTSHVKDGRTHWGVAEWRAPCVRCGAETPLTVPRASISTKGVREALEGYGCNEGELQGYLRTHYPHLAAPLPNPEPPPCKRHKASGDAVGWTPIDNKPGTLWAIAEVYRCAKCGLEMNPKIASDTVRPTQKEAMEAYGLPRETIDGFFPPAPKTEPVAAPLTSWPFPVSSRPEIMAMHAEREQAERNARERAMEGMA